MNEKKIKLLNILLYGGLVLVIAFTIITAIVVNYKRNQLDDLKNKNQQIEDVLDEENETLNVKKIKNFSKNLFNFIDKQENL